MSDEELSNCVAVLKAKLTNQTHMIAQVFALLDVTEETEDGRVFHPNQIRSSRALDAEKLDALLAELRDTLTANDKEMTMPKLYDLEPMIMDC